MRRVLLLAATVFSLAACADRPPANDPIAQEEFKENNDPLEPTNRVFYAIGDGLDAVLLRPFAVAYRNALPGAVRRPLGNLVNNLNNPVIFANDALQTDVNGARDTFMRLLINTSIGVGGLFDVAGEWGYKHHDNDFGLTMALWNVPTGPYMFTPVLGPGNPRDAAGYGIDVAMNPITWPANGGGFNAFRLSENGLAMVSMRADMLDATDSIKKTSLDPYATYRSLYQQHRASVVEQRRQAVDVQWKPQPPAPETSESGAKAAGNAKPAIMPATARTADAAAH